MDYTKYHVVPSALYRRIMEMDDKVVDDASKKPAKILKEKLPDDAKILLHGLAQRDGEIKQDKRKRRPIVMEHAQPPQEVDRMPAVLNNGRAIALYEHLKENGIGYNDKGEAIINGSALPNTNLAMIIRGLTNANVGYQLGMQEVLRSLPTTPPPTLISQAVLRKHTLPAITYNTRSTTPHPTSPKEPKKKGTSKAKQKRQEDPQIGGRIWLQ